MSAATPYRPSSARNLALVAVFAAFIAVLGPLSIPIAGVPVPLSLGPLAIYVTALVLGGIRAFAATSLYVLMGCLGLPIFAQGGSGFGSLAGPTGGYLIGYPLGTRCRGGGLPGSAPPPQPGTYRDTTCGSSDDRVRDAFNRWPHRSHIQRAHVLRKSSWHRHIFRAA